MRSVNINQMRLIHICNIDVKLKLWFDAELDLKKNNKIIKIIIFEIPISTFRIGFDSQKLKPENWTCLWSIARRIICIFGWYKVNSDHVCDYYN